MRSPAWPSQSAGRRASTPWSSTWNAAATMASGSTSHDAVRALGHRDRPLGVLPQRQARHAERGRLLLHAAGVGEHDRRGRLQCQEVEVAERLDDADAVGQRQLEPAQPSRPCAGARGTRPAAAPRHAPSAPTSLPSWWSSSTFDGRCSVTRAYGRRRLRRCAGHRCRAPAPGRRLASSVSIMTLPTRWIWSSR